MKNSQSTHFIFDGEKVILSPDLWRVFNFLKEIEKEIETILGFDKKLESIRKQYLEMIELAQVMSQKIKENSIDFSFNFSEHPNTIVDKLKMNHPVRSKFIVLFANLDTLLCLNIAYENRTSDRKVIIDKATKDPCVIKSFLEKFCLNEENEWGRKNQERLKNITADNLRRLRNSLIHFFSVDKNLQVAEAVLDDKSRRIEQATDFRTKFISPEDLYEIIKGAYILMIKKWNDDCLDSLSKKSDEFKEKILSVNNIIKNYGAIPIKGDQINI